MDSCPACGESIAEPALACPSCGADLGRAESGPDREEREDWGGGERWGVSDTGGDSDVADEDEPLSDDTGTVDEAPADDGAYADNTAESDIPTADVAADGPATDVDGPNPHEDSMLEFALRTPTKSGLLPVAAGGALEFAAMLVPFINLIVNGYAFRLAGAAARGQTEPPAFEDIGELLVDGLRFFVVTVVYLITGTVLGGLLTGFVWALSDVAGAIVGATVALGFTYLFPASLTVYAAHREIEAAFDVSRIGRFVRTGTYLKGYLAYVLLAIAVTLIGGVSLITLVGIFFVVAWATYAYGALWGYCYREAVAKGEVPHAPAEGL
jgi:hypothetical protein